MTHRIILATADLKVKAEIHVPRGSHKEVCIHGVNCVRTCEDCIRMRVQEVVRNAELAQTV